MMGPEFKVIRDLPPLNNGAVERAVEAFTVEAGLNVDPVGFFNQTLQRIANATYMKAPGNDFWLAHENGEVVAYALANVTNDLDGKLCYWVSQSWVDPAWRGKPIIKNGWHSIRRQAVTNMCAHLVVVSCRNVDAHCRWLGEGMVPYATILKQELGAAIPQGVENGFYSRRS